MPLMNAAANMNVSPMATNDCRRSLNLIDDTAHCAVNDDMKRLRYDIASATLGRWSLVVSTHVPPCCCATWRAPKYVASRPPINMTPAAMANMVPTLATLRRGGGAAGGRMFPLDGVTRGIKPVPPPWRGPLGSPRASS